MHGDGRRLFYLCNRIQALEEKLSQVTLKTEEPKPALVFPGFDPAKLKPRQTPRIQLYGVYRVFETTELSEAILLHLSERDLLQSQRVNKAFKATIQGSIKIKKTLYFAPADGRHHIDGGPIFNTIFLNKNSKLIADVRGVNFMFDSLRVSNVWNDQAQRLACPLVRARPALPKAKLRRVMEGHVHSRPPWDVMVKFAETEERKRIKSPTLGELLEQVYDAYI